VEVSEQKGAYLCEIQREFVNKLVANIKTDRKSFFAYVREVAGLELHRTLGWK